MSWDMGVAARTLWQECRGEPLTGQVAVAHAIKNRLRKGRWGDTLASVCLWRGQFSGWYVPSDPNFKAACSLPDDDPMLIKLADIMQAALDAQNDPTQGATHYCTKSIEPPFWTKDAVFCGQFGSQLFYRGVK